MPTTSSIAFAAAVLGLSAQPLRAADSPVPPPAALAAELTAVFQPWRTAWAALSPDGRYLAYAVREGETLAVWVVDVDQPQTVKVRVTVATDSTSTPMLADTREKTPAAIRWMEWVTPARLVVETNRNHAQAAADGWTNCPGEILAFDADGGNARTLVTPRDVAEPLPASLSGPALPAEQPAADSAADPLAALPSVGPADLVPRTNVSILRSPHAYDYVPGDPDSLLVLTDGVARPGGSVEFGVYRVNIISGKVREVSAELADPYRRPYFDRQGRLRIEVPDSIRVRFPHRFVYETAANFTGRKDLDRVAGLGAGPGFSVSPADFFGERAVPVGFDEHPEILYFASNIGRDTYGLYGLNLKTGRRTGLAVEDPNYDLIGPSPGQLPEAGTLAADARADAAASTASNTITEPPAPGDADGPNAAPLPPDFGSAPPAAAPSTPLPAEPATLVRDRFTRELVGVRYEGKVGTTRWLRPGWQAMQEQLEAARPGRSVEIEEWDRAGRRFLVLAYGPADPGAYYLFDRGTGKLQEFVRRAPWLDAAKPHPVMDFAFANPAGGNITGRLTFPAFFRVKPVPLVIVCPPEPWARATADFQPEVQALADMGFAVAQFNARGAWGFGIRSREAIKAGYEEARVADLVTLVQRLAQRFIVDPRRVALLGKAQGGFVALRALQLAPQDFRCAVAINAPVDLKAWIEEARWTAGAAGPALVRSYLGDDAHLQAAPLVRHPELVTKPVLLLGYPGRPGDPRDLTYLDGRRFAAAVRAAGTAAEWSDLDDDYMHGLPQARAAVFGQIEDFLNTNLYDFKVKVGVPVKQKD